jgi:hypothetical protein
MTRMARWGIDEPNLSPSDHKDICRDGWKTRNKLKKVDVSIYVLEDLSIIKHMVANLSE